MKSLLQPEPYQEILERISQLHTDSRPQWGKMHVAQMLKHCQRPLEIAVDKKNLGLKSNFLVRLLFKKAMYNDSPFRKNMPTPASFKVSEPADFNQERGILLNLIKRFYALPENHSWHQHPVFGKLTAEQWVKMQYKHLDHHLTQFQV